MAPNRPVQCFDRDIFNQNLFVVDFQRRCHRKIFVALILFERFVIQQNTGDKNAFVFQPAVGVHLVQRIDQSQRRCVQRQVRCQIFVKIQVAFGHHYQRLPVENHFLDLNMSVFFNPVVQRFAENRLPFDSADNIAVKIKIFPFFVHRPAGVIGNGQIVNIQMRFDKGAVGIYLFGSHPLGGKINLPYR